MKLLGIDYGEKRVGVAVSDDEGKMAFPKEVLVNDDKLILNVLNTIDDANIQRVVIGESKDYKGSPNKVQESILKFQEQLSSKTGIEIVREPEFMTSKQAERIQGNIETLDASAAAIILQSYIDKNNYEEGI